MEALIGNGLVGKIVSSIVKPAYIFTSSNIGDIQNISWDTIWCAAPSGNRITAHNNPDQDTASVDRLIDILNNTYSNKIVLFSTGDTQVKPNTVYGANRLKLEQSVQKNKNYSIIRLPGLIHKSITKNILYDIRNRVWLDKINPNHRLQWLDLNNLRDWIYTTDKEVNVCSEPILARDLLERFVPDISFSDLGPGDYYDLKPYSYTQAEIFDSIEAYLR